MKSKMQPKKAPCAQAAVDDAATVRANDRGHLKVSQMFHMMQPSIDKRVVEGSANVSAASRGRNQSYVSALLEL